MSDPQHIDPALTREANMEAMRLHEDLVTYLWARLTPSEREIYTRIIDDPRNIHISNIITLAFAAGLDIQWKRSASAIQTTVARGNKLLDNKNDLLRVMSGIILGLSVAVMGLLGYIILT